MACPRSCRRRRISSHGRRSECRTPRCARSRARRRGAGSALRRRRFYYLSRGRRPGPHRAGAGARAGNPAWATRRAASPAARIAETARPWAFPARHDTRIRCLLCLTQRLPCRLNLTHLTGDLSLNPEHAFDFLAAKGFRAGPPLQSISTLTPFFAHSSANIFLIHSSPSSNSICSTPRSSPCTAVLACSATNLHGWLPVL